MKEIGTEGQARLEASKVLVVGAGGLGCPALQYLAAAGVGQIGIVDYDEVELSNLQRQVLFGSASIGKHKALVAKEVLEDLNSDIIIKAYPFRLEPDNVLELFSEYDIVVDGTDNFETRYLISDAAVLTAKPVVYGAIYKFEGQVAVFNYKNGPTYRCLFPDPPAAGSVPNCSEIGVLGVLPGIIGCMQANEVIKIIIGLGEVLSGRLLCLDTRTLEQRILNISKSENVNAIQMAEENLHQRQQAPAPCIKEIEELSLDEAKALEGAYFIDVREAYEEPRIDIPNLLEIPLGELASGLGELDKDSPYVLVCQTGVRSKAAVEHMLSKGFKKCFNLKDGIKDQSEKMKTQ